MKQFFTSVLAVLAIAGASAPASAQEFSWKMGHLMPPGSSYLKAVQSVPDRIDAATDGRVKIELFPTLFQVKEQPQALRDGRLDMITSVHPYLSGTAPTLSANELPGLILGIDDYRAALAEGYADHMREVWSRQFNGEVVALGAFDTPVIMSNRKLEEVSDFRGLKIRVPSAGAAQLMGIMGARPVQLAFPEIAPALSSGVVDAVLTDAGTSHGMGFHNIAKFINVWNSGVFSWSMVVNKDVWATVPGDLQDVLLAEFKAIEDEQFAAHKEHSATIIQMMVDEGMTLVEPSQEEIDKLYAGKNTARIYDAFSSLAGKTGSDGDAVIEMIRKTLGK